MNNKEIFQHLLQYINKVEMNKTCKKCGGFAGFENSPEGEACGICGDWICPDCSDTSVELKEYEVEGEIIAEDVICKECRTSKFKAHKGFIK